MGKDKVHVLDPGGLPNGFFTAIFRPNPDVRAHAEVRSEPSRGPVTDQVTDQVAGQATPEVAGEVTGEVEAHQKAHDEAYEPMTEIELKLLTACLQNPKSTPDLLQILGYRSRTGNFKKALSRLLSQRFLEMTNPQKPRAKNQRYRISWRGQDAIKKYQSREAKGK